MPVLNVILISDLQDLPNLQDLQDHTRHDAANSQSARLFIVGHINQGKQWEKVKCRKMAEKGKGSISFRWERD